MSQLLISPVSPEKECYTYSTESSCSNISGCTWGACLKIGCWDYSDTDKDTCEAQTGFSGNACKWQSSSGWTECVEQGCWNYGTKDECQAGGCQWDGSYCMEYNCGSFSAVNETYCTSNSKNLSCQWDANSKWCGEKGCWNFGAQNECTAASGCSWKNYEGGWCEELGCWSFDNNQSACEDESNHPGLSCEYDIGGDWCYEDIGSKTCAGITTERNCMDTFYCWWNYTAQTCYEPTEGMDDDFTMDKWSPGCFIFDMDEAACTNTTGCTYSNSKCEAIPETLPTNSLNCSLINNQTLCNQIPALDTCCKWTGSECQADKFDQSCRQQMQEPPEGAYYCEDYNAFTDQSLCEKIAGSPWYMPCTWDNSTERCHFKGDDVFGGGDKNIMLVDNEMNCKAAGGKWILDTYPSTNDPETAVKMSLGRCDYKFDEERNCDKECFACEYKSDKTNWSTAGKAKKACLESSLGICTFKENSNAANGYGFCEPKDVFKSGQVSNDCNDDCSACTFMGDASASSGYKPSDYCRDSKAKCKWIADPSNPEDESLGRCVSKSEKTCEDKCDKCYEETTCKTVGGKGGESSASAVCEWSSGICVYKSGADNMEICWDGTDNNGDNKIDCADSQCFSDPFCGGDMMFGDFGVDCFIYDDDPTGCTEAGCAYVNETWGSWCDLPMATCWKKDGTNQTNCEEGGICEWHSGFGGFCEQDFEMGGGANSCFAAMNTTDCQEITNCTWVVDDWCTEFGGWCDMNPSYSGNWFNCMQYDKDGEEICDAAGTADGSGIKPCSWQQDPWCAMQNGSAGFCDHMSFGCMQFGTEQECTDTTNATYNASEWCTWMTDSFGDGGSGFCESKMMSQEEGCWSYSDVDQCNSADGCSWMSGFCDPPGFGGDMMMGMPGMDGDSMSMGGNGMQCFIYDGNETACTNKTGCGWFSEPSPFCDVNFESNCPQYSYNESVCAEQSRCKWNAQANFCDEKPFECFWNDTLQTNLTACGEHALCSNNSGFCEPMGFMAATEQQCDALGSSFRWMSGWCNPSTAASFFKGMEMGGPPIPLGDDVSGDAPSDEVDITSFGLKDMGEAYGIGITVVDPANSAACNDVMLPSGKGTGTNKTKFYWYLDTDGNSTNNCALQHNASATGFEFYIRNSWTYDANSGQVNENPAAYKCSDGSWQLAEIKVSSQKQMMCSKIGGVMVAIGKSELNKYSSLYDSGSDMRITVSSAIATANSSLPSDIVDDGWVSPGSQDFDLPNMYNYESDSKKKAGNEAAAAGFIEYSKDVDCWTETGCADYSCQGHEYCVQNKYGVEADDYVDSRVPKVIGITKESYPDSAFFAYFTDKPTNGSFLLYDSNICSDSGLMDTIHDIGVNSNESREYKLWHIAKLYNDSATRNVSLDAPLSSATTYYYKLKVCDDEGKCGISKCSNFTTATSKSDCSFCKFVSRIKAPTGWDVHYDLDRDGTYEHWQGNVLGPNDGMFTNYTNGRYANIKLNVSNGTGAMEFLNVTLTKTGMSPKIREIDSSGDLKNGTLEDTDGDEVGYVGMVETTRDKIVHNLFPEVCKITIPGDGTCDELWHCNADGNTCVNRTASATLETNTSNSCVWKIPYCEFSIWAGGEPSSGSSPSATPPGGSGGSSRTTVTLPDEACSESWLCTSWGECTDNVATRECYDLNSCGTTVFKPTVTKDCSAVAEDIVAVEEDSFEGQPVTGKAVENTIEEEGTIIEEDYDWVMIASGMVLLVILVALVIVIAKNH